MSILCFENCYSSTWFLLACLIGVLYYYSVSTYDHWKHRGVPYLRPVPLFGNAWRAILWRTSKPECFQKLYKALEGHKIGGLFNMRTPLLMLRDPDIIKQILIKDFSYFQDRECLFNKEADVLVNNLFTVKGSLWRYLRTKLTPAFTTNKMKNMMFPHLSACAEELKAFLEEPAVKGEIIEVKDVMSRFTINAIGHCAFGIKCNCFKNKDSPFYKVGKGIFTISTLDSLVHALRLASPTLFSLLRIKVIPDDVSNFFTTLVKDTIDYRLQRREICEASDFISILIQLRTNNNITKETEGEEEEHTSYTDETDVTNYEEHFEFTDHMLAAQAFVFFMAGYDTSSTLLSMCLLELALNPEIQQRLQQETDVALREADGNLTYGLVQSLVYLDMVISETLRLYPPGSDLMRTATRDYQIPGCSGAQISAGDLVIVPVFSLHRDPRYFPDPETFDPERFTNKAKALRPAFSYLPFGEGPRNCIGKRFGLLQTKVALVVLISQYQFNVSRKTTLPITLDERSFTTVAKGGVYLRITKRNNIFS